MLKRYNSSLTTGNLSGVSGTSVTGASIFLGNSEDKIVDGSFSAYLILTAATSSITMTPAWQVSNDGSTFSNVKLNTLNTAAIAVVTGVANVTTVVHPPPCVAGYQYARMLLTIGGATGAATDLYSIGYSYKSTS